MFPALWDDVWENKRITTIYLRLCHHFTNKRRSHMTMIKKANGSLQLAQDTEKALKDHFIVLHQKSQRNFQMFQSSWNQREFELKLAKLACVNAELKAERCEGKLKKVEKKLKHVDKKLKKAAKVGRKLKNVNIKHTRPVPPHLIT